MKQMKAPKIDLGSDINDLEEKALASLKSDQDVYRVIHDDLELTNAEVRLHLGSLIDLQNDMNVCKSCPGLENCPKSHPAFCMKLAFIEGELQRLYEPCKLKQTHDEVRSRFFIRDFPEEWMDLDIRNVDRTGVRKELILKLQSILKEKDKSWIYVTGKHRIGKSFILAMLAKEYAANHRPVGFALTSKLIDNLKEKAIKEKEKFDRNMKLLGMTDLLVLDEFGNEFKSDFVFANILYPLLSTRAKEGKLTWFTSDFEIEEIVSMYKSKIGDVRARQFQRLLVDCCGKEIELNGVAVYDK